MIKLLIFFLAFSIYERQVALRIGNKYTICGPKIDDKDPFEKQPRATVIITAMKGGYVQYCWASDYKKRNKLLFSRSEKEFINQIKDCN